MSNLLEQNLAQQNKSPSLKLCRELLQNLSVRPRAFTPVYYVTKELLDDQLS
jgi:hypothetical protein